MPAIAGEGVWGERRSPPNTIAGEGVWGSDALPPNTIAGEGVWGSPPNTIVSKISLAVFDLDGTIADSLADIAAATNRVFERSGRQPHPLEAFRRFVGSGVTDLIRRAAPDVGSEELAALESEFRIDYLEHLTDQTVAFPGIAEALARLDDAGVRLAVLSNKPHAMTTQVVERLFDEVPWVAVFGQRDGVEKKPDATALFEIADKTESDIASVAMVGDTPVDVKTALAAGARSIAVSWGFRPANELRQSGAEFVVQSAAELADRILTMT